MTKPQRQTPHVATADDPWLAELDHAFGDLEGKAAAADVWKVLKLSSYGRTMDDQMRLTAVMRLLGLGSVAAALPRRGGAPGVRARDRPAHDYVFLCPITGQISSVGHDPAPTATRVNQA